LFRLEKEKSEPAKNNQSDKGRNSRGKGASSMGKFGIEVRSFE